MKEISPLLTVRILEAIDRAKNNNEEIVSINMTADQEKNLFDEITKDTDKFTTFTKLKLETIYGVPVKRGKEFSITIKI